MLVKNIECGFIPNSIDIEVEGQCIKLCIKAIEGKSYRVALAGKTQRSEEEDDELFGGN